MSDKKIFILRDKQIVSHALAFIGSLSLMGKPWQIEVKPYVRNRSRSQEKLWHAWVSIMAKDKGYTAGEMKILLKAHFNLYEYVTNKKTGAVVPSLRSTADLNVMEYMDLITQTEALAAKEGILLPRDQDWYDAMGIEQNAPTPVGRGQAAVDNGHGAHLSTCKLRPSSALINQERTP